MSDASPPLLPSGEALAAEQPGWFRRLQGLFAHAEARQGMLSLVDQAVVSATSFFTSVLIGRNCSAEQLGVYYLALSVVLLLIGVQAELLTAPYTVFRQRKSGAELAAYSGSTVLHQLAMCLFSVLCFLGMLGVILLQYDQPLLIPVLWVLCGFGPFLLMRAFIRHFEFAAMRFGTVLMLDVLISAIQLTGLWFLIRSGGLQIPLVYCLMGGACAVASLVWFFVLREPMTWQPRRTLDDWGRNWTFARWALISHLVGCSTPYVLPWLLASLRGEAATGRLSACDTIIGLSYMFVMAIANALTPLSARAFARDGAAALMRVLRNCALLFLAVLGPFCLVVLLLGDRVVVWVYGDSLQGTGFVCFLLALRILVLAIAVVAGNGLWALEKPKANLWGDATTMLVTLVGSLLLIHSWGIFGAALAMLLGAASGAAVHCLTLYLIVRESRSATA